MSNKNEKLGLLAQLIKMAQADQKIREIEFQFLLSLAAQMGVTKDDFKQLFEENIEFNPPRLEAERIVQFQRLILLMNVDLEIDDKEIEYIKDVGIRMGLHPSATNTVLEEMHNYKNKIIPPERLLEIFNIYHN
ncbi:MAG: TerB family tellurite resistance protein [Crocinitomicaceae bacterium]|nr:TerB family tellurite resistance protein [Flavobacteriales bacterium]NQZ34289.1 TerB family tellurite resistance protein [Crocinitomicaceae bacterium]